MPISFHHDDVFFVWNTSTDYVKVHRITGTKDDKFVVETDPFDSFHLWTYLHPVDVSTNYFGDACMEWLNSHEA